MADYLVLKAERGKFIHFGNINNVSNIDDAKKKFKQELNSYSHEKFFLINTNNITEVNI